MNKKTPTEDDLKKRLIGLDGRGYKGNRKPSLANKKSEGRIVPKRPGNAGGGKAPYFHRVS